MPVLLSEDIDEFLKYAQEQLDNERVLYQAKIIDAVEKIGGEKHSYLYTEQWMFINLPSLLDGKSAMVRHYEEIMTEKFEYYNRTNNYEGLCIWIDALLRNIGFTSNQTDRFVYIANKIGEKLFAKKELIE